MSNSIDSLPRSRRKPALLGGEPLFSELVSVSRALSPDRAIFSDWTDRIFASRCFSNDGPAVRELEARLAERLGVEFCLAFCNGTAALQAALHCLDLSGEVITTPFTFPATVHAIALGGLTPVFCDIDPETYNLDAGRCESLVTDQTSALLPVHVFGTPCDPTRFSDLAERRDLRLVFDAAHAFGVSWSGRPIGRFGDLSVLSFHASKLFHTAEGGAVLCNDAALHRRLRDFRNFGIRGEVDVSGVGFNGKMSELHAALGLALLDATDRDLRTRARLGACYEDALRDVEGLALQRVAPESERNFSYLPVRIDPERFGLSRDEVHLAMWAENIITRRYFFPLACENEAYRGLPSARRELLPNAHRVAEHVLCMPIFGELGEEGVSRCVDALLDIREAGPGIRTALKDHNA